MKKIGKLYYSGSFVNSEGTPYETVEFDTEEKTVKILKHEELKCEI